MALVKSESISLPGVEIRCANKTVKTYDGVKKVKVCGALNLVINSAPCGVDLSTKCRRCDGMIRYISS